MDSEDLLRVLRQQLEHLRAEYIETGRGDEFDRQLARLKADGRYPFDD